MAWAMLCFCFDDIKNRHKFSDYYQDRFDYEVEPIEDDGFTIELGDEFVAAITDELDQEIITDLHRFRGEFEFEEDWLREGF